jgi:hypothetical protein
MSGSHEAPCGFGFQDSAEFTLKYRYRLSYASNISSNYLDGIWAAPEAGTTGVTTTGAGAVTAAPSSTLPELAAVRAVPK